MVNKRDKYFDFLRGLAIIFVVICHSYNNSPLDNSFRGVSYLTIREIVTCAVPIFLAISGYFLSKKVLSSFLEYKRFLKNHSFRIWIPMVIWSLPLWIIGGHGWKMLIIMCLGGYSIYYYITLIIQFYALQPFLKKNATIFGITIALLVNILFVGVDNWFTSVKGVQLTLLIECGPFVMWLVFPLLGYYLADKNRYFNIKILLSLLLFTLLMCIVESRMLYLPYKSGLGYTKISAVLFSCVAVIMLFSQNVKDLFNPSKVISKVIVKIGENSFGVYLIHKYYLDFCVSPIVEDMIIRAFLTLSLSITTIYLSKFLFPKYINSYLGFR